MFSEMRRHVGTILFALALALLLPVGPVQAQGSCRGGQQSNRLQTRNPVQQPNAVQLSAIQRANGPRQTTQMTGLHQPNGFQLTALQANLQQQQKAMQAALQQATTLQTAVQMSQIGMTSETALVAALQQQQKDLLAALQQTTVLLTALQQGGGQQEALQLQALRQQQAVNAMQLRAQR